MRKIGIVTDSHSSITQKMAKKLEIMVLSMPFYFGLYVKFWGGILMNPALLLYLKPFLRF